MSQNIVPKDMNKSFVSKNMNYEILLQKGFDPIVGSSSSE